jgi:hypothetical protein
VAATAFAVDVLAWRYCMFWRILSKIPALFWTFSHADRILATGFSSIYTGISYVKHLSWPQRRSQKVQGQGIAMTRRRRPLAIQPSQIAAFIWLLTACSLAYFPSCSTDVDFYLDVSDHMFSI